MGFRVEMKTKALIRPLRAVKRHYMGLNLAVFWQIKANTSFYFQEGQSDGFTGVFSWGFPVGKA